MHISHLGLCLIFLLSSQPNQSLRFIQYRDGKNFIISLEHRHTSYRETIQTQAYNLDNLVGNVGGYTGLFLGYALVQIPDFFLRLINSIRKYTSE